MAMPLRALLRASHFPPTLAVTAFTTALAAQTDRGWGVLCVAAAVLCGQFTVGWTNDVVDADRDRAAGRTDKPIAAGEIEQTTVRRFAVAAGVACVPLSLLSGRRAAGVHVAAVAVALLYDTWLKRTMFSVVPYAVAFGLLPAFVSLGAAGHRWPPVWATIAAGCLGSGAHFLNTLPDLASDAGTGVRGLPHRLGPSGCVVAGAGLLAASTGIVAFAPDHALGGPGIALSCFAFAAVAAVVTFALAGRARTAWTGALGVAAITVALYLVRSA